MNEYELAGRIAQAVAIDEQTDGCDLSGGLFGRAMSDLIRELVGAPAFQEPVACSAPGTGSDTLDCILGIGGFASFGPLDAQPAAHLTIPGALEWDQLPGPVEIEYPEYSEQGMGCGLEDRGITDRYEAMRYGYDEALDQFARILDGYGPLYTRADTHGVVGTHSADGADGESALIAAAARHVEDHLSKQIDILTIDLNSARAKLVERDALLAKCKSWIEAARDGVLYPIANEFQGVIGHNAEGLGQLSVALLDSLSAVDKPKPIAWHIGGNGYDEVAFSYPSRESFPGSGHLAINPINDVSTLADLFRRGSTVSVARAEPAKCESCGDWGHIETEDSAHDCPECGPSVIERAVEAGVMNAPKPYAAMTEAEADEFLSSFGGGSGNKAKRRIEAIQKAKQKTCIECDQPYCHGVCVERGDQDYDRDQAAKGGDDE